MFEKVDIEFSSLRPRVKDIEVLLLFAEHINPLDMHKASKMFWFADKEHLNKWGRPISDEKYVAMEYGPVPSKMYNHFKQVKDFGFADDPCQLNGEIEVNGRKIIAKRSANIDLLSESEIEIIQKVAQEYGCLGFSKLTDMSHTSDYKKTKPNNIIDISDIVNDIGNKYLKEHLLVVCGN